MQALLSRSLRLIDTYDPPDMLALQLRSVAGLRWLPPGPWLTQVCVGRGGARLGPTEGGWGVQLRSVAGLRWLLPGPWLSQVCKCGGDLMRGGGGRPG